MWLEVLRSKDEAFLYFKKIKALAESDRGVRLRAFRTDRGGEFNSIEFTRFCEEQGVRRNTTAPYSPQQNGVVERRNQTVVEMARSLMKSMQVPATFWAEAVRTAVHILNRSPTRSLKGLTPYEAWRGRKPKVDYFRTFGCVAHMKIVGPGMNKLSDRSRSGVFVGYEEGSKAYRVFDPVENKLYITRDVVFEEEKKWAWSANGDGIAAAERFIVVYSDETEDVQQRRGTEHAQCTPDPPSPPTSPSARPSPDAAASGSSSESTAASSSSSPAPLILPTHHMRTRAQNGIFMPNPRYAEELELGELDELCMSAAEEPSSVDEALEQAPWRNAMEEEMRCIRENMTWELSTLPTGHRAIGLKWVFKVKRDPAGNVLKHKARLVAK
jgi:hypothetical protein